MANQDFDINIRVNANTSQVDAIRQSFEKLGAQVQVTNAQAAAGAGEGGIGGGIRASVFGVSAVGVGLTLKKLVEEIGNEQVRITEELGQQLEHLTKLEAKWSDAAASVRSQEDVAKLAVSTLGELDAAQKKFNDHQNAGVGFAKEWADTILSVIQIIGGPRLGGIFEKAFEAQSARDAENVIRTRKEAWAKIHEAEAVQERFEGLKALPFEQSIPQLQQQIAELTARQKELSKQGDEYTDSYITTTKQLQNAKAQLEEILKLQEQANREQERAAREREREADKLEREALARGRDREKEREKVQEQVQGASPQARAALMNEQAAQLARDQGREREADLFQKSAERYKQFATPQQKEEIGVLEKLIEQNGLLREIRDSWK